MDKARLWMRDLLAVVGMLALGSWLAGGRAVQAASEDVLFQLQGVDKTSSLLVYQPSTKTVYLYQGAMVGNAALQCNYMFQMGKPGGVIHRQPCAIQNALP